jgi:hypothetical protein
MRSQAAATGTSYLSDFAEVLTNARQAVRDTRRSDATFDAPSERRGGAGQGRGKDMTRTRTSVLLTAVLVVAALTAGISAEATTNQAQDDGVADAAVESGSVYWQGQFLQFSAGEPNASTVWSVREADDGEVGTLVTELLLNGNGSAVFATDNLDGEYVLVNADGDPVVFENGQAQTVGSVSEASFEVTSQTLNASFEDGTVVNDESPDSATGLRLQSNRAEYRVSLFSEQLSASELADVFQNVEARDGRAVATRNASDDDVFEANFSGVEPGTYDVTVVATDGVARDTATITVSEPVEGTAGLANATVVEQRGDVARFNVTFDGAEQAQVRLGSPGVGYVSQFTVVDADGDGEATVAVNTFREGLSADESGISAVGEDEVIDYRLETDPISGSLDAATYPIVVSVGATRSAVGSLTLNERSTDGVQVWTAPDRASVDSVSDVAEVASQDDTIAYQDWAIVQVEASGLSSYVQNLSDFDDDATGVSMTLTDLGGRNVPPTEVSLDRGELFVDETGDRYFLVIDSNALEQGATYQANFTISEANPYVEAGNGTSYVTNFTVVERNASFDDPVEVPASSDATISGSSTVAPGTELTIEAANTQANPFLQRGTATVAEDGTWEVTLDLSDVAEGTNFTVSIDELDANATGTVVAGAEGAADGEETLGNETTTPANDAETTPTDDAETTPADDGEADDGAAGATGDETTEDEAADATGDEDETTEADDEAAADETDTTTEETTTTTTEDESQDVQADAGQDDAQQGDDTNQNDDEAGTAPAPGFGPVTVLLAVVALLAAGLLATRRR